MFSFNLIFDDNFETNKNIKYLEINLTRKVHILYTGNFEILKDTKRKAYYWKAQHLKVISSPVVDL